MITKTMLLQLQIVVDNIYLDKYIQLVNDNLFVCISQPHKHHIIPRYYYIHNNLTIDESKDNIVNLSYEDHIIAHYYLARCSTPKYEQSNIFAISLLTSKQAKQIKNVLVNNEDLDTFLNTLGIDANYYWQVMHKPHSKLHNEKMRQSLIGHVGHTTGKHVYNNGVTQKFIKPGDPIPQGFVKGGLKWSEEQKRKLSERMSGAGNPFYGKHHSEESKLKRKSHMPDQHGENNGFYGKHHSEDTKRKLSAIRKGKHWYTNGIDEILSTECPEGYTPGRSDRTKQNQSNGIRNKHTQWHWYTNGEIECHTDEMNFNDNLKQHGFYRGRLPHKNIE